MAEAKGNWLQGALTIGGDVLAALAGAILGASWVEGGWRQQLPEILKKAKEKLELDREDVMKELLRLMDQGAAIVELLKKTNAQGGIITVPLQGRDKRYLEHQIVNFLLKVEPKDRQWVFAKLNQLLKRNPEDFFTHLELTRDDDWLQYARWVASVVWESLEKAAEAVWQKLPDRATVAAKLQGADQKLTDAVPYIDQIGQWLESKGVRR